MTKKTSLIVSFALLAAAVLVAALVVPGDRAMFKVEPLHPGPGVTRTTLLSEWFPKLKGTHADTEVYILDSGKPGGKGLIIGGTHPNEPAGILAPVFLIEHAKPEAGVLYVIPHANASAISHSDIMEGEPRHFGIDTPHGRREFRFGSRASNPIDQWPDPDIYVHAASGQHLSGSETRNLNRAYPGRPDGTFTERLAYGIASLIRTEQIDVEIDLHEASPEYPVICAIVAHERAMPIASEAVLDLEFDNIRMGLEPSPVNLHGLSHRELGDHTNVFALLMENSNPSQGRLRGKSDEALIVDGKDDLYVRAAKLGRLFVPFDQNGWPLKVRVARHVAGLQAIFKAYSSHSPQRPVLLGPLPSYDEMVANGLGKYF
ncbi:MAG: succinylglutamate desuccinylase/aspartoacylase family protein [Holophaga sp.]|nr:succinylglutamate desuccinylase/aspartoacylase family protein [Holophaga sp.]